MNVATGDGGRLCQNCQSIVKNILPSGESPFVTARLNPAAANPAAGSVTTQSSQPGAWPDLNAQATEIVHADVEHDRPQDEPAIVFETGPLAEQPAVHGTAAHSGALNDAIRESGALEAPNPVEQPSLVEEFATLHRTAELTEPDSKVTTPPPTPEPKRSFELPDLATRRNGAQTPNASAVRAPQQNQAWNVESEWPVLIQEDEAPASKWKIVLAVAAVLALAVAATGYYLLMIKPKTATVRQQGSAKPAADSAGQSATGAKVVESPKPAPAAPQTAAVPPPVQAQPAGSAPATDQAFRFSLQAASFPNAAAANEFSEKLFRAGLPAYVVGADIPGRGRWYRVRVGRFTTQDEAQRFIGDAKSRARTAGVTLQLVPCDYEKPDR